MAERPTEQDDLTALWRKIVSNSDGARQPEDGDDVRALMGKYCDNLADQLEG